MLREAAEKMNTEGDAAAPQVDQATQELCRKWNNILGIIETRTKISRTYVTFHKTLHSVSTYISIVVMVYVCIYDITVYSSSTRFTLCSLYMYVV